MLRLLADENLDYDLVRGALRLRPTLNFVRVQDVGFSLFFVHQEGAALSRLIDDLLLLDECSDNEE
jgi:hypothetical protein